ncbi:MAG TPA: hypothetical protein VFO85_06140, partial [Vicinamibacteria bacterium]|nr:hypothetical protein [Vicinamibacteria bacterium]
MKMAMPTCLVLALSVASPALAGKGNRCSTRTPTLEEQAQIDRDLAPHRGRPPLTLTVPVWVHVINTGSGFENGDVSDHAIRDQIKALNDTFGGRRGGADTGFAFELAGVDRTTNAEWFFMLPQTIEERRAKEALRQGGAETLNIYTVDGGPYLGWAY